MSPKTVTIIHPYHNNDTTQSSMKRTTNYSKELTKT